MGKIVLGVLFMAFVGSAEAQNGFDHQYSGWQVILNTYASAGRVQYRSIKENEQLFTKVVKEIESISKVEYENFNINQQKSFWINAYNIGAMEHILDNYPIKRSLGLSALRYLANSIQQIPNVWNKPILNLLGQDVSLNDIENKILRPEFKDPRIHFAIVCASIGCPVIRSESYTAERLDQQLSDQIRLFLSNPLKARYDKTKDVLYLSPIFKWFKTDFEQVGGTVNFIKKHSPAGLFGGISERTKIQWLGYDWSLNES